MDVAIIDVPWNGIWQSMKIAALAETYEINLENGGLIIEYNDGYDLSGDLVDAADDAIEGLKDGSISTGT